MQKKQQQKMKKKKKQALSIPVRWPYVNQNFVRALENHFVFVM